MGVSINPALFLLIDNYRKKYVWIPKKKLTKEEKELPDRIIHLQGNMDGRKE